MDDTLSIIEDMLQIMAGTSLPNSVTRQCADELIDRVRAIRKQQEQDCLQEAEDITSFFGDKEHMLFGKHGDH